MNKTDHRRIAAKKRRFSIAVTPMIYSEIQRIARRDSRSIAWVVRKAVEDFVRQDQPLFHQELS